MAHPVGESGRESSTAMIRCGYSYACVSIMCNGRQAAAGDGEVIAAEQNLRPVLTRDT